VAADYGIDRKHLTRREIERLIEATKDTRNDARDRCRLVPMFRHEFVVGLFGSPKETRNNSSSVNNDCA